MALQKCHHTVGNTQEMCTEVVKEAAVYHKMVQILTSYSRDQFPVHIESKL